MVYYEPKVNESDRCFAFTKENNREQMNLFEIKYLGGAENLKWQDALNSINMKDSNVVKKLIKKGESIIENEPKEVKDLRVLSRDIKLNGESFRISFESPKVKVVDISLHDNYKERVRLRQY